MFFNMLDGFDITAMAVVAGSVSITLQLTPDKLGWIFSFALGLGRFGAVIEPAAAGYLIAAGLDMSANYLIFSVPMAIGGLIAYRLHIR